MDESVKDLMHKILTQKDSKFIKLGSLILNTDNIISFKFKTHEHSVVIKTQKDRYQIVFESMKKYFEAKKILESKLGVQE